jgi:hypothetical protein
MALPMACPPSCPARPGLSYLAAAAEAYSFFYPAVDFAARISQKVGSERGSMGLACWLAAHLPKRQPIAGVLAHADLPARGRPDCSPPPPQNGTVLLNPINK